MSEEKKELDNIFRLLMMPTLNSPCAYYRMEMFIPYMRAIGNVEVGYRYNGPEFYGTCKWQWNLSQEVIQIFDQLMSVADVAVFQNVLSPKAVALLAGLKEQHKKPILCELDDFIMDVQPSSLTFEELGPGTPKEHWSLQQAMLSDGLIVSTDYLGKIYQEMLGIENYYLVPNGIEFNIWDKIKPGKKKKIGYHHKDRIRIGWTGGGSHDTDLKLLRHVCLPIVQKYKNVEFYFYGQFDRSTIPDILGRHKRIIFDFDWTSIDKWPAKVKSLAFDIGVAPLCDNNFNRCKSNIRLLEYAAAKVPTVASPVEPYKKTITLGKDGFLAQEPREWIEALSKLIEDKQRRLEMGQAVYEMAKKDFNAEKIALHYVQTLLGVYTKWRDSLSKTNTLPSSPTTQTDSSNTSESLSQEPLLVTTPGRSES